MRVYNDIRELIGNTPMLRLHPFETAGRKALRQAGAVEPLPAA